MENTDLHNSIHSIKMVYHAARFAWRFEELIIAPTIMQYHYQGSGNVAEINWKIQCENLSTLIHKIYMFLEARREEQFVLDGDSLYYVILDDNLKEIDYLNHAPLCGEVNSFCPACYPEVMNAIKTSIAEYLPENISMPEFLRDY